MKIRKLSEEVQAKRSKVTPESRQLCCAQTTVSWLDLDLQVKSILVRNSFSVDVLMPDMIQALRDYQIEISHFRGLQEGILQ